MVISYKKDRFPDWAEVQFCEIICLPRGQETELVNQYQNEILFVLDGALEFLMDDRKITLYEEDFQELTDKKITVTAISSTEMLRIAGSWGRNRGTCGVFTLANTIEPRNDGDPADYPRNTVFDNHYHDCDEYWVIIKGKGVVVNNGKPTNVQMGDCVITRSGYSHDFPWVAETIQAIWFEGSMKGEKRPGHLYRCS